MRGEDLVLECTSCETEGFCPQIALGEGANVVESEEGPMAFLIFLGAHPGFPGHWDPQKHYLRLRLGERKLYPSEVARLLGHMPWLVERLVGSYPSPSIQSFVPQTVKVN